MQIALSVKNKTVFIDGTLSKRNFSDQSNYNAWMCNNKLIISLILSSLSKEIYASPQNTVKNTNRDRPYCTHYKFQRHTIDKCQKLHGYPRRYKPKNISSHVIDVNTNEDLNVQMSTINNDLENMFEGFLKNNANKLRLPL